jgi:hypothetical protein
VGTDCCFPGFLRVPLPPGMVWDEIWGVSGFVDFRCRELKVRNKSRWCCCGGVVVMLWRLKRTKIVQVVWLGRRMRRTRWFAVVDLVVVGAFACVLTCLVQIPENTPVLAPSSPENQNKTHWGQAGEAPTCVYTCSHPKIDLARDTFFPRLPPGCQQHQVPTNPVHSDTVSIPVLDKPSNRKQNTFAWCFCCRV